MKNIISLTLVVIIVGGLFLYISHQNNITASQSAVKQEVQNLDDETNTPFSISNVAVDQAVLKLGDGDPQTIDLEYIIKWKYESQQSQSLNAYIIATIVDEDDSQVAWLKGVGVSEYASEQDKFSVPQLCSVVPSEGCLKDDLFNSEKEYRIKIGGANCLDEARNPGYCDDTDRLPIEPAYSNSFKLTK